MFLAKSTEHEIFVHCRLFSMGRLEHDVPIEFSKLKFEVPTFIILFNINLIKCVAEQCVCLLDVTARVHTNENIHWAHLSTQLCLVITFLHMPCQCSGMRPKIKSKLNCLRF